jgi:hypothetical protein
MQFSQYQTATQKKIHKKILSNTTNYNFCCDYGCNCSNLTSYKKKLQHIQKHYCYDCLTGCNSRNREIATPVIKRLITMKSIKKPCVLRRLQTSAVIIVATPAINRLQKQKCDRKATAPATNVSSVIDRLQTQ